MKKTLTTAEMVISELHHMFYRN